MRLIGRRLSQTLVVNNTDRVVAGFPIPADGVLNSVFLEQHIISSEGQHFNGMGVYGTSGFVFPVMDPDGGTSFDNIWDAQVPKDVALSAGALDIDTGAIDTAPEFELGLPDLSSITQLTALEPVPIFQRRAYLSLANAKVIYTPVSGGEDTAIFTDFYSTQINRTVRVPSPSVVLFGTSSPDMGSTTTTVKTIPTEPEWLLLQYLEVALEQAFMSLAGLTEGGATVPYANSLAFIAELVEDTVLQDTASRFIPNNWTVFTRATFDISVPGTVSIGTLTSDS